MAAPMSAYLADAKPVNPRPLPVVSRPAMQIRICARSQAMTWLAMTNLPFSFHASRYRRCANRETVTALVALDVPPLASIRLSSRRDEEISSFCREVVPVHACLRSKKHGGVQSSKITQDPGVSRSASQTEITAAYRGLSHIIPTSTKEDSKSLPFKKCGN